MIMFLILTGRVILGVDGFIKGPSQMGSQLRIFCFGLNVWIAWGDVCLDGNGYKIWTGFPRISEVL